MKSILISINPKWREKIASGEKTVEVRKTRPKLETPFKVYIYCTMNSDWLQAVNGVVQKPNETVIDLTKDSVICELNGKVIGEFVCDRITKYECSSVGFGELATTCGTCLTYDEILNYCNGNDLYGWHISDLVIYDKPRELSEFFVYCNRCDKRPIACKYAYEESNENGYYSECMCDFKRPIERPPQSWCYVEEVQA